MTNPWEATPASPPFVLEVDRLHVEAWNEIFGSEKEKIRLHLEALPEPAMGPRDAPLVLLSLNPGWSGTEPVDLARPDRRAALRANLDDDPAGHIHAYLTKALAETSGGEWWRDCLGPLVKRCGLSYETLAHRVLSVEFHGYHSESWSALPVTLPSQWYGFQLVAKAIERGAVIVALRGWDAWDVAVPALREYPRRFRTNNKRRAWVSSGNLPPGVFDLVVDAVQA
jgi:hypothetical protein